MKDLGITKGNWWPCCADTTPHFVFAGEEGAVCSLGHNEKGEVDYEPMEGIITSTERIANAALIADAGNTAQKCGLLPSELLSKLTELYKEASKVLAVGMTDLDNLLCEVMDIVNSEP